jgi:hypothetical protein
MVTPKRTRSPKSVKKHPRPTLVRQARAILDGMMVIEDHAHALANLTGFLVDDLKKGGKS